MARKTGVKVTMVEQQYGYGPPTPVPIFQWEKEFSVLLELYRRLSPKRVLEIGTYHGGTLYHWLQNAAPGATVVSLDSYVVGVDNRDLYDDWVPSRVTLHALEGDAHLAETAAEVAEHGPFDWVLIDAGHYLNEVTADWNLYSPMVKTGGVVCFHDILLHPSHPEIEVAYLWEEIKQSHSTFEIVADRNAGWGGIGVVLL